MEDHDSKKSMNNNMAGGGIYGLALIGAAVYFVQHSTSDRKSVV
jgi:hypothetical protein